MLRSSAAIMSSAITSMKGRWRCLVGTM